MPNVEHTYHSGKVHIKLGDKTACGEDLTLNPTHWRLSTKSVSCIRCKESRH